MMYEEDRLYTLGQTNLDMNLVDVCQQFEGIVIWHNGNKYRATDDVSIVLADTPDCGAMGIECEPFDEDADDIEGVLL